MLEPTLLTSHNLVYDENHDIVDLASGEPFDAEAYSRMKYGNRETTRAYGQELAENLIDALPCLVEDETAPNLVVMYKAVPPACYYLSRYCLDTLNIRREAYGNEPGTIVQVHKSAVMATNYAAATPEQRQQELDSMSFSLCGHSLTDKPAVLLDDIRITGAAEKKALEVIVPEKPAAIVLGYVALFDAKQAMDNPSVENDLNRGKIRATNDLLLSIRENNFDLNIRTLKLILAAPEAELNLFLQTIPAALLETIHQGAVETGTDFMLQYNAGFRMVHQALGRQER